MTWTQSPPETTNGPGGAGGPQDPRRLIVKAGLVNNLTPRLWRQTVMMKAPWNRSWNQSFGSPPKKNTSRTSLFKSRKDALHLFHPLLLYPSFTPTTTQLRSPCVLAQSTTGESEGGDEEVKEPVKLNSSPPSPKRSHGGQGLDFASGLFLKLLISVSDPKWFSLSFSAALPVSLTFSLFQLPRPPTPAVRVGTWKPNKAV